MVDRHYRCQFAGLGWHFPDLYGAGCLEPFRGFPPDKYIGAQGDISLSPALDTPAQGTSCSGSVRQHHGGSLHQSPGGHTQPRGNEGGGEDPALGGIQYSGTIGSLHPGSSELGGRLSQPELLRSGGMGTTSGSFCPDLQPLGGSPGRSDGFQGQSEGSPLHGSHAGPTSPSVGCSGDNLEPVQSSIHLPAHSTTASGSTQDQTRIHDCHSSGSGLAQETLVLPHSGMLDRCSVPSATAPRPPATRTALPPAFTVAAFDGVAIETSLLRDRGFSEGVVRTMLRARQPASARIYHRTWRAYFVWCEARHFHPLRFSVSRVLAFLQNGLDLGLALSSLKGQISALSVLFHKPLALKKDIKTFIQGVSRLRPAYRHPVPPWDLNLVLDVLQDSPFEPLRSVSLRFLTWKVLFLVAITSIRRVAEISALSCDSPFLVLHKDKVVLRTPPGFLPKVVSSFHLNEDIVLPSLCPSPANAKEVRLHSLDIVRAVKIYLARTAGIRKSNSLFVIPDGPRIGLKPAKSTLSRWVRSTIEQAYREKHMELPPALKAHSTRAVGASWAIRHQASALQLCKAATWSSVHTFSKFYQVHTYASADAALGRKILRAAIS